MKCDLCANSVIKPKVFLGGICVCEQCVNDVVLLHITTKPIKTLCPMCNGLTGYPPCPYCGIPSVKEDTNG